MNELSMNKYYLDTDIWIDCLQGKSSIIDDLLMKNSIIIYSDILEEELLMKFLREELAYKLSLIPCEHIIKVKMDEIQFMTAEKIAKRANLSISDVIHAIIAKDNQAIFLTNSAYLIEGLGIVELKRPKNPS